MNNPATCEQMRDEYLTRVNELYERVRKWVLEFDSSAEIAEEDMTISERPGEPYEAKKLVIARPGCKTVCLVPRGRWIIGAEGRVDMKSDLGTETLVYASEGGPGIRIDVRTESGKELEESYSRPIAEDVAEGWVFVHDRRIGMLPSLDADLFCRLLEVLGR